MKASRRRETPDSSSGAIHLSPIHSDRWLLKLRTTKKKSSSSNATLQRAKTPAATGRSCAIVVSTLTTRSPIAGSGGKPNPHEEENARFAQSQQPKERRSPRRITDTIRVGLFDARRVGASPCDMARLAPRGKRLAGQIPRDSLGLRRNRSKSLACQTRVSARRKRHRRKESLRYSREVGRKSFQRRFLPRPHRPRLDARLRPDLGKKLERRPRLYPLAIQRLGEIQQPQTRRRRRDARQQVVEASRLGAHAQRKPRRARRRQHRRQRPRFAADDRGMLTQQNAGAQPRLHTRGLSPSLPQLSRRDASALAPQRHRR